MLAVCVCKPSYILDAVQVLEQLLSLVYYQNVEPSDYSVSLLACGTFGLN